LKNILTAIYSKFSGSAFSTDVGGRIYLDEAPNGAEFPYCVFFVVSGIPDNVFGKKGKETLIQFSLFSKSQSVTEIATMYADLRALFDECTLSITGNTFIDMHEENLVTMVDEVTTPDGTSTVKHWAVDYQITTQES
jgi:hypothetical protein